MKKRTLIKALIAIGLGAQVFGLTPSLASHCFAQDQEVRKPMVGPKTPAWVSLGGKLQKGLSVLTSESSITVFGVGTDNALWTITSEDKGKTWGGFVGHGGDNVRTAPACSYDQNSQGLMYDAHRFRCFWIYGSSLYSRLVTATGNGDAQTIHIGEKTLTPNPPSAVGNEVFAHGNQDDGLWKLSTQYGQMKSDWQSMGGKLKWGPSCAGSIGTFGTPIAVPYAMITCYVVGTDDAVWVRDSKGVWIRVGGQAVGGVNAFSKKSTNEILLAVSGTDSTLWIGREVKSPTPEREWQWKNYPGEISSVPACTIVFKPGETNKESFCFAIRPDGQLGVLDLTGRL